MAKNATTDKELDDSVSIIGDHRLHHRELCMVGTRTGILQESDRNLIIDIRDPVFMPDIFFYLKREIFSHQVMGVKSDSGSHHVMGKLAPRVMEFRNSRCHLIYLYKPRMQSGGPHCTTTSVHVSRRVTVCFYINYK